MLCCGTDTVDMAGGGIVAATGGRADQYNSKFNFHILIAAIVAASAGLLFGYDIGVTGGKRNSGIASIVESLVAHPCKRCRPATKNGQKTLCNLTFVGTI